MVLLGYLIAKMQIALKECSETEYWVEKARFAFFPGDLEYLKAGGRVSNAAYLAATLLGLRPLIEILDGKLVGTKKYRGSSEKISSNSCPWCKR